MLAVGALSMLISGFAPIHATDIGFDQQAVATLMFALPIGTVLLQIPLGWASDRTDRRYAIFAASAIVAIAGVFAWSFDGSALAILIAIYLVWSGASDSIYSLSTAHASDRASKEEMVTLSGTLLFIWSISGFIAPGVGTILTVYYGTGFFMPATIIVAVAFCLFVAWRIVTARPVPQSETGEFIPISAQAPPPLDQQEPDPPA
jgi:MFS family permease